MKVNELKALFEKNGLFQNIMTPAVKSILDNSSQNQSKPLLTNLNNIELKKDPPASQVQNQPIRRNNEFLNQLNKKLMNKSSRIKPVDAQQHNQEFIPKNHQPPQQLPLIQCPISHAQSNKLPQATQKVEEQLNFDDIIGNIQKRQVMRSGIRARLGINQRNPSTQEQLDIFAELQKRQSQPKKNELITDQLVYRVTKLQAGAYRFNPLYNKLQKKDKIARIDHMINNIFGNKQKEQISKIIEKTQIKPAIIKMESPIIAQVKQQEAASGIKNEEIIVDYLNQHKSQSNQIPNRTMLAMSKEMLSEMNMKIKRRNDLINAETNSKPQQGNNDRDVSPLAKKKKHFQKFDDS